MRRGLRAKMRMRVVHSLHGTRGDARDTGVSDTSETIERRPRTREPAQLGSSLKASRRAYTMGLVHRPHAGARHAHSDAIARPPSTCIRAITCSSESSAWDPRSTV